MLRVQWRSFRSFTASTRLVFGEASLFVHHVNVKNMAFARLLLSHKKVFLHHAIGPLLNVLPGDSIIMYLLRRLELASAHPKQLVDKRPLCCWRTPPGGLAATLGSILISLVSGDGNPSR